MRDRFAIGDKVLVAEGAMGTMLLAQGLEVFDNAATLNDTAAEAVRHVHELYSDAGATCATSNTFSPCHSADAGERKRMAAYAAAGVRLAREANPGPVLGDVGPSTLMIEPVGPATFDEAYAVYRDHIAGLVEGGADAIILETFIDVADMKAALLAAKDACDLPIIVSCTFNPDYRMPISSTSPEAAAAIATALGAAVVGENCWFGPEKSLEVVRRMSLATDLPLIAQPNAGLPEVNEAGETVYPGTVEEMAAAAPRFVEMGAVIVGSCCGTTPEFTAGIAAALEGVAPVGRSCPWGAGRPLASSHDVMFPEDGAYDRSNAFEFDCMEGDFDKWDIFENAGYCPFVVRCGEGAEGVAAALESGRLEETLKLFCGIALVEVPALGPEAQARVDALAARYGAVVQRIG